MIFSKLKFSLISFFVALVTVLFVGCSDDDSSVEFLFDREVTELTVIRSCADKSDSISYCYQIRFHAPMDTSDLEAYYIWVDSTVVGDTAKKADKKKMDLADTVIHYDHAREVYKTVDLTSLIQDYVKERDSLMVGIYCGYSDKDDPGSIQRVYLHFGDDMPPSLVALTDSVWTTGALFRWNRPTDQTDYYAPNELSGPIVGYNIILYAEDDTEDIRDLKVTVSNVETTDSTGDEIYRRHSQIYSNNDSIWVDSVNHGDKRKNYLFLSILDGKGYDTEDFDANAFSLIIEGLRSESRYTIGIRSFDSSGKSSGNASTSVAKDNQLIITTDSVAPLIGEKIFTIKDTLYPELARLDSNNRLRIFWSRSIDPMSAENDFSVDSVVNVPDTCLKGVHYKPVRDYVIDYYDTHNKTWDSIAGGTVDRYSKYYAISGDTMKAVTEAEGIFITDTVRWVAPSDTLILRIRARDLSKYYSKALIDTIVVSPGALAQEVECPEGFVPVSAGDTNIFCMERYEHMDDSGKFVTNVLHSEAVAACEGISASGFTVGLCKERDWELVCLSGALSYGVIKEDDVGAIDYLFSDCNVATNDSASAADLTKRNKRCMNPMGVHDLPGQFQEWVMGRSEDTSAVAKGGSFRVYGGMDRETQALCTNRSFPYYTRPAYTQDPVYLYREGTRVDTVFQADTSRTLYAKLTKKDFKDSLQFFDVMDSSGNVVGTDYVLYSEYKRGGDEWLDTLANGMTYSPTKIEVVFLTGEKVAYRQASAFYKSYSIGFRCCAYPE
ncbi:MAG: hypothetical protein MJZ26_02115 [Fibrobacter sp.]|nr:hypothetical protein [Fibrobacter sp.]